MHHSGAGYVKLYDNCPFSPSVRRREQGFLVMLDSEIAVGQLSLLSLYIYGRNQHDIYGRNQHAFLAAIILAAIIKVETAHRGIKS